MDNRMRQNLIDVARGIAKAELVIKNGRIVNVFTKEIIKADIAVQDGMIAGIGRYEGAEELDASNQYICPGLIDGHVHMESSLVTPREFLKAILPHGTTTVIADPHEIANVCGKDGIRYILEQTKDLPFNVYLMAPSCVPALTGADLAELGTSYENIIGLGEVMDYGGVLCGRQDILQKLHVFCNAVIDGHAPRLSGRDLNAYCAAGIATDHECSDAGEVMEKLRLGMYVQIREGSAAKNLEGILKGLLRSQAGLQRCIFCTDDKHLEEIRQKGHIDCNIRKAVETGVDPIDAVCMATLNTAACYRLANLGAIAPGYYADIVVLNDLRTFDIDRVLLKGKPIESLTGFFEASPVSACDSVLNTVKIKKTELKDLRIVLNDAIANVIQLIPGQIITRKVQAAVKTENGVFIPDETYAKLAVVERHRATGNIGLGIVEGFSLSGGAIAGTVAHDAHNIIVAGVSDADMLLAIEELKRAGGGFTAVRNGSVICTLKLPVAGLMSLLKAEEAEKKMRELLQSARMLCKNADMDPFMTLSFLSLPVIPEIRLTETGLYDVDAGRYIGIGG